jgi:hypothetical protein
MRGRVGIGLALRRYVLGWSYALLNFFDRCNIQQRHCNCDDAQSYWEYPEFFHAAEIPEQLQKAKVCLVAD